MGLEEYAYPIQLDRLRSHPTRFSLRHPTSIQKCPNNNNYPDITTISAIFAPHSISLHDTRNRTFTLTYENDDHSCRAEHATPPASLCRRYAAELPSRRACCSVARQHHFADATPTKLRRAERVRPASPRSLCGCCSNETPPRRARSPRGHPHHFAVTTPTTTAVLSRSAFAPRYPTSRCRCYAYSTPPRRSHSLRSYPPSLCCALRLRLSAAPSKLLCGLAGSSLVLYALLPPPMTFTFISSTPHQSTVLGNRTNDHQKAFMELLGMAALHLAYVPYASASDGISAGGRRYPRHRPGPNRLGRRSRLIPSTRTCGRRSRATTAQ